MTRIDVILPYASDYVRWLPACLRTLASQVDVHPIVHLIADGVPPEIDPGPALAEQYPCVRLYRNADGPIGPYISFNRIVAGGHATTGRLAVADADDLYFCDRLAHSLNRIRRGADVVGGSMVSFIDPQQKGDPALDEALKRKRYRFSGNTVQGVCRVRVMNSTMVLRYETFVALNGFEPWLHSADIEFVNRAEAAGAVIHEDRRFFACYRVHRGSLTQRPTTGIDTPERERKNTVTRQRFAEIETGTFDPLAHGGLDAADPSMLEPAAAPEPVA